MRKTTSRHSIYVGLHGECGIERYTEISDNWCGRDEGAANGYTHNRNEEGSVFGVEDNKLRLESVEDQLVVPQPRLDVADTVLQEELSR